MRMAPPGRKSNSQTGLVNLWGPHHRATCFGSVHTLNTSSRGASNTRVSTNSCSSLGWVLLVAMVFLLFLDFPQIFIQTAQTLRPKVLITPHPIPNFLDSPTNHPSHTPL